MSNADDDTLDFLGMAAQPAAPARADAPPEPLPYDPELALRFFNIAGVEEAIPAGTRIFAEGDRGGLLSKPPRVYLLLEGEVTMTLAGKPLAMTFMGDTFGELAVISDAPRSATATARKFCRVISLDQKQFVASLKVVPEFALMLISMMADRLRRSLEKLVATNAEVPPHARSQGLSRADLAEVGRIIGKSEPTPMKAGDVLIAKGALGAMMYVLVEGQAAAAIDGRVVEYLNAGGIFGETAMLGKVRRGASVTAETDGAWLPLVKNDFLKVVSTNPAIGIALLGSMSERIRAAADQIRAHKPA